MKNSVSIGYTNRGHWVHIRENGENKLVGPLPTHEEATRTAADECTRLGMGGMYRGVPTIL